MERACLSRPAVESTMAFPDTPLFMLSREMHGAQAVNKMLNPPKDNKGACCQQKGNKNFYPNPIPPNDCSFLNCSEPIVPTISQQYFQHIVVTI